MSEHAHTSTSNVLVVGGGMAGLATAYGLRRNGASVTLVEQAPEFGEVGAGLQMAPNSTRLLKKWGLLDRVKEVGVMPERIVFRDAVSGEELTRQTLGAEFEERYGAPYVVIHRSDLHRVLLDAARDAGVELVNNVVIDRVDTVVDGSSKQAHAVARDGRVFTADVVIGADGLKSGLRKQVSADAPVGSHYVAYRGTVPAEQTDRSGDANDVVVWFGPECHLVQYPLRNGELRNTVAVFKSPSFARGEEQYGGVDELEDAYRDCVPEVREALQNLWRGIRWPMYDREPIENWVDGRLLLVGDAAHPMLQYLAQGAGQALVDASTLQDLSRAVFADDGVQGEAWDAVLREFNDVRAPRTARVQRTARVWGEAWHVDGLARLLRNMLFASRKDGDFQYSDWLYGKDEDLTDRAGAEVLRTAGV